MPEYYIGLMSGTSIDGIDAGLVEFIDDKINLLAFEYLPYSNITKEQIQRISQPDYSIQLKEFGALDVKLGMLFSDAANKLLAKANILASEITAIGSHGQTVFHSPDKPAAFSLQIGDPNIIAEETGITTIADFRRRDMALGGQGAPLVPAFHHAIFSTLFDLTTQNISIVNIGGIANITYLSNNKTIGFDTGPGNALMDFWVQKNLTEDFDKNGDWAKSGTINEALLKTFKSDPYFQLRPPKSTGKEYFSFAWLQRRINQIHANFSPEDIQATLCQFTADTITEAIHKDAPETIQTIICGGGMHNQHLINLIQKKLDHPVSSTEQFGINPDHIEAMAFAWLARQTINNLPGNLTEVTGAKNQSILGGIYPSNKVLSNSQ